MNHPSPEKSPGSVESPPTLRKRISPVGWIVVAGVFFTLLFSGWQNYQQFRLIDQTLEKFPEGVDNA